MFKTFKTMAATLAVSSFGAVAFADDVVKPAETTQTPTVEAVVFAGDIAKGKRIFKKCKACHSVKADKNGVGPSLHGIIGAQAAAVEGYKYSKAMKASGLTWDVENLTAFLTKPKGLIKGTKMSFGGLKKEADIENLLAYLADATK